MSELKFYEIDPVYISYLSKVDKKVPQVDYSATSTHDKFLCGIVLTVGDHNYFAPISSFKTPQRTNLIIKSERRSALSSIRFSFMIPVPHGVATLKDVASEPSPDYRRLLDWELQFCNKNARAIFSLARFVYDTVINRKDPIMVKNCCDFKALEKACAAYERQHDTVGMHSEPTEPGMIREEPAQYMAVSLTASSFQDAHLRFAHQERVKRIAMKQRAKAIERKANMTVVQLYKDNHSVEYIARVFGITCKKVEYIVTAFGDRMTLPLT
jgi:protein AbiQ